MDLVNLEWLSSLLLPNRSDAVTMKHRRDRVCAVNRNLPSRHIMENLKTSPGER
jgi:hypothetical protein